MAEGFPDKNFCRPGHFGARLLDTVDSKKLSILCEGMVKHLRDKSLSVAILSNPQEGPLLIRKWRGGFGTPIFLSCAEEPCGDHGALQQNATSCDNAIICGKTRPITAFHCNAIAPRLLADPTNERTDDERKVRLRPPKSRRPPDERIAWSSEFKLLMHYARSSRKASNRSTYGGKRASTRAYLQRCAVRVTYLNNKTRGQWKAHGRYLARESATHENPVEA